MARRLIPSAAAPREEELSRRMRELAHELGGPEASFVDLEMLVLAISRESDRRALEAERP